ncbi:hypothetical protein E2C01_075680 [Portunus trituberculatus]|uniref:Uncharacterized protein n=1 Tax=Portunus trituberculatus TaxID=210409 RepID=A0A5B7I981_PORTR|nr:hypothetical protein [Portunus trituberculatus]
MVEEENRSDWGRSGGCGVREGRRHCTFFTSLVGSGSFSILLVLPAGADDDMGAGGRRKRRGEKKKRRKRKMWRRMRE